MRLVHTADIHLDTSFAAAGLPPAFGNRRRQSLRDVFRRIVRRAADWPADALLVAGDVFEGERIAPDTVAFVQAVFKEAAPLPIFVAPGNHDPATPESPWVREAWPDHVHIFTRPAWSAVALDNGLTVHGFGFDAAEPSANPFGRLTIPDDGAVHVAVAHGSAIGHQPPGKTAYAAFDPASAAAPGLRYLALGHFHAATELPGATGVAMWYSGAPEGRGFDEEGLHHHLEVTIGGDGTACVEPVGSSSVVYARRTVHCSHMETTQELVDAVRAVAEESDRPCIARVRLEGSCPPDWRGQVAAAADALAAHFEHLDLVDALEPAHDYEALAADETSLGAFVRRINDEIADAPDAGRRALLERAREVGLAAYRGIDLPVRGAGGAA